MKNIETIEIKLTFDIEDTIYCYANSEIDTNEIIFVVRTIVNGVNLYVNKIMKTEGMLIHSVTNLFKNHLIPVVQIKAHIDSKEINAHMIIVKKYIENINEIHDRYITIDIIDKKNIIEKDVLVNNAFDNFYERYNHMESTI